MGPEPRNPSMTDPQDLKGQSPSKRLKGENEHADGCDDNDLGIEWIGNLGCHDEAPNADEDEAR
jgi:hypothetical protein